MNVSLVPVIEVDRVWPLVREGLENSCTACGGDLSAADLWRECRSGNAFLILVLEEGKILSASAWRPETWSSGGKLRCLALYGVGLWKWIGPLRAAVLELKQNVGAESLVAEGLEKWGALFKRLFPNARKLRVLYEEECP